MKRLIFAGFCLGLMVLNSSCGQGKPAQAEGASPAANDPFHSEVFQSGNDGYKVSLLSDTELELSTGGAHYLCKYTVKGSTLRAVATIGGSTQALYFEFVPEGLRDERGVMLYGAEGLKRKAATDVLGSARQLQLAMQMAALDNAASGKGGWPTEFVATKRELKNLLVKDSYLAEPTAAKLMEHLAIGKVSDADSGETIVGISDNVAGSKSGGKLEGDYFVIYTKGGSGGIYPISKFKTVMENFVLPPLLAE